MVHNAICMCIYILIGQEGSPILYYDARVLLSAEDPPFFAFASAVEYNIFIKKRALPKMHAW